MTYREIFESSKKIIMEADVSSFDNHLAIEIDIEGEGSGIFYIELKDKQLFVEPYEYYDRDCRFITTAENFIKLAEGKLDAIAAYTTGKLKIEGSIDKALEFKNILDAVKKQKKTTAASGKKANTKKK